MSEQEYAKVFAKNLRNIMYINRKTQADLSRDLGITKAEPLILLAFFENLSLVCILQSDFS